MDAAARGARATVDVEDGVDLAHSGLAGEGVSRIIDFGNRRPSGD